MYLYSQWTICGASDRQVQDVVGELGAFDAEPVRDPPGRVWSGDVAFSSAVESSWERSQSTGARRVVIADLPVDADVGRMIGVMAPTQALATDFDATLGTALRARGLTLQPVRFSLRALLNPQANVETPTPRSVRLRSDVASILVQATEVADLRIQLAELTGEVTGVTLEADGQSVTVFDDGNVVFTDPATVDVLVGTMRGLEAALQVPVMVR